MGIARPAPSRIALTTSRTEALQARRSCASSLDTFTQSFLRRAWPKTRGPEIGSRSALIVVAHVFSSSAPRARRRGKEEILDQLTFGTSCGMTKLAEPSLHEQCRYVCIGRGGDAVPRMAHSLCVLRVECGKCCHCQRPSISFRWPLVQACGQYTLPHRRPTLIA